MEKKPRCVVHHERPAEYVCLTCTNPTMCEMCKLKHAKETGHAPENFKEIAHMRQRIQDAGRRPAVGTFRLVKIPRGKIVATKAAASQYEPVFAAAYKKSEVLVFNDKPCENIEKAVSDLISADMSKFTAVYIDSVDFVNDDVALKLAPHLQYHSLSKLYLKDFEISNAGAKMLAEAAFHNKSLSAFCIWGGISDTGAEEVAKAARNCKSLNTFYLYGFGISDLAAKAVAEAMKDCPLSVFHLGSYRISDLGAAAVANAVNKCPLSVFYLQSIGGKISDLGVIAVAKAVKNCPLSVFALVNHTISDEGATAVAKEIVSGGCASTLSAFYLSSCRISDLGAKKVADIFGCSHPLSAFFINDCSLSGETVAYILKNVADTITSTSASASTIIRSVNLRVGKISKEQMDSCLNLLQPSGAGKQIKLRFQCNDESTKIVCEKSEAEWNGKLAEFRIVKDLQNLFEEEMILGVPQ